MQNRLSHAGFSLLEMIGVMAVMGILAGALAPSVFQMLEAGYRDAESKTMGSLSQTLQDYVQSSKAIPDANDWATEVADFAGFVPRRVTHNDKNYQRQIYFSPRFFTNKKKRFTGYVQDQGLTTAPYAPKIMIVSSLDGEIKAKLNTQAKFDAVWQQSNNARIKTSKSVYVSRLNLAPVFRKVLLSNSSANRVAYSLEGGIQGSVSAASAGRDGQREIYVISDSMLEMRSDPYPSGDVLRQAIVSRASSYRYQEDGGLWSWHD